MRLSSLALAAALALSAAAASAATHEVQLLNRGEAGAMVFEPAFVKAAPGDVIHFVATDPGHNVVAIEGMLPEGVEAFASDMGQDFELTRERIRQIEAKALRKLRHPSRSKKLRSFVESL